MNPLVPVTVYHNESPNRFFTYEPGDKLRRAFHFEKFPTIDDDFTLEEVFFVCNVADDPAFPAQPQQRELAKQYRAAQNRSLSVGDVVAIHDDHEYAKAPVRWYSCESVGWAEITDPFQED